MVLIQNHQSHPALLELHRRYSKQLLGFFIKMLNKDTALAQDFVQEVFLKLLEKNHLYDPNKKFYTWLFTIASNMCKTAYRHTGRTISLEPHTIENATYSDNLAEKNMFLSSLQKCVDQLEYHHKTVFVLRFLELHSLNEIADITETSVGTVKSRLFYATKKIAADLKPFNPSYEADIFKLI